jgi:SSS family solute:Na+ symporter
MWQRGSRRHMVAFLSMQAAPNMLGGGSMRRYVGRVEDFLVAGREMDVYLGIASLAASEFGIITCMYAAENG